MSKETTPKHVREVLERIASMHCLERGKDQDDPCATCIAAACLKEIDRPEIEYILPDYGETYPDDARGYTGIFRQAGVDDITAADIAEIEHNESAGEISGDDGMRPFEIEIYHNGVKSGRYRIEPEAVMRFDAEEIKEPATDGE